MTHLRLQDLAGDRLRGATADVEPGFFVIRGTPAGGADELIRLLDGSLRPRRGQVTLDGVSIHSSPRLRRRVASLRAIETLPSAPTVASALNLIAQFRGLPCQGPEWLKAVGAQSLAPRRPESLQPIEGRLVGLAVALAIAEPELVVLYEPLAFEPPVVRQSLLACERHARRVPVLWVLCGDRVDSRLGRPRATLAGGVWSESAQPPPEAGTFHCHGLGLRRVAAGLAGSTAVDELRLSAGNGGPETLLASGRLRGELSKALLCAIIATEARLFGLRFTTRTP